jgi:dihydrodipicolinate synthase/N-acetylneuraminate lyase
LPRRRLDERRNVEFLEKLARAGVPAVLIAASTGHGHLRTVVELEQWFQSAADANLGSTLQMALLRPEDGQESNRRLIERLREWNYSVVFVRPGTDLKGNADDGAVAENMRPIVRMAAECQLPVGVYSIPDVSGLPLTADAAAKLLDGPGGDYIVAAKVTENDYETSTLRYLDDSRLGRLKIVQGWDTHLARALKDGPKHDPQARQRSGVTSGPMSFAVFQYMHIFEAAVGGDWDEVEQSQHAVTALFQSMQDDPQKFADLQRAKFIMGLGHPLTSTTEQQQVDRVLSTLKGLPRKEDRARLARSLDLMADGPFHDWLSRLYA